MERISTRHGAKIRLTAESGNVDWGGPAVCKPRMDWFWGAAPAARRLADALPHPPQPKRIGIG